MSTDGDELTQGYWRVSLNKQLTECEWRRPLTWLDRFRDAVLLPASWRDENIQPHVGKKYLKIDFSSETNILASEASTGDPDAYE